VTANRMYGSTGVAAQLHPVTTISFVGEWIRTSPEL
jgi:hypothetical protein